MLRFGTILCIIAASTACRRPEPAPGSEDEAHFDAVSEDYFAALGIPIRRGRAFTLQDRDGAPLVALVSESVAREYWPGENPIGQRVRLDSRTGPWREVVGIVGDVRESPALSIIDRLRAKGAREATSLPRDRAPPTKPCADRRATNSAKRSGGTASMR